MISDPYSVLGVSQDAGMDEIKKAYRKKAKECHPDLHPDDPKAAEKMNEINEAYDMLTNPEKYRNQSRNTAEGRSARPGGTYGGSYGGANDRSYGGSYGGSYGDPRGGADPFGFDDLFHFGQRRGEPERPQTQPGDSNDLRQIIDFICMGQYGYARQILNRMVSADRNARWYYLSALTHYGQGNNIQAVEHIQKALQMEPDNPAYRKAMQDMTQQGDYYTREGADFQRYAEGMNRMCLSLCAIQIFFTFCRCC